ncbi:sulfite dehydrogenase [Chitinophaga sp. Cy-1792]|uniref:sulfite dehydrogenase n=1 Tax=Chitinophaga sp. Cy-1792 TaxID=2608339 RepID=UPI00141FEAE1|nr:sulfite dehydrogenase [Chitinophaga sp. Cy-1792]NIG55956.1 sulfite dehydrogenase [Chitinophaga sp. Cy-1792]
MEKDKLPRRTLLRAAAVTALGAIIPGAAARQANDPATADPTKTPGAPVGKVGTRSPYEQLQKKASDISARAPLQDFYGIITPSDLHFERSHNGVPAIHPDKYELLIHGMVERPMVFTLRDLKRFPALSRIAFIECSGNFRTGKETMTPQEICGLTSQSEWTGVMLSTLFREVGVHPKATWFLAEGSDAAVMTRSIPVSKGWSDAMIAYGQNGEAIRPEQGYPARLFLPGWEGNTNVKWIRRIELTDKPFMTREETSKYTETIKGGKIRQFSFDMDARSIITYPAFPQQVERGWIEIRGIAWSGRGKIERVEISTDAGRHWQPATLQEPVLDKAHTLFRYGWKWDGQNTEIMSRAVDNTGYVQPFLRELVAARGRDMGGYHVNPVTSWLIQRDGKVLFKPEKFK